MERKKNSLRSTRCRWTELPYDVLVKIFMSLNIVDLVTGASGVCRSWRVACSDPELWREIDFNTMNESNLINIPKYDGAWSDPVSSNKYLRILKSVLNLSLGSVTSMTLHYWVLLKDEHLLCVAQRTPNLKRLVLSTWNRLTIAGFDDAVKHWKDLQSLTLPCPSFQFTMMKAIGTYCKNFSELTLLSEFDLKFAEAIITYIPGLKVFNLQQSIFFKEALMHLMNKMNHLEVLNISHSLQVKKAWHGHIWCVYYVEPDDEIIKNGSQFDKFVNCQRLPCACKIPLAEGISMHLNWKVEQNEMR